MFLILFLIPRKRIDIAHNGFNDVTHRAPPSRTRNRPSAMDRYAALTDARKSSLSKAPSRSEHRSWQAPCAGLRGVQVHEIHAIGLGKAHGPVLLDHTAGVEAQGA